MNKLSNALSALKNQQAANAPPQNRQAVAKDECIAHLSQEQKKIAMSGARLIKVQAYAGTGKTTVLQAFAERASMAKGLYLTFNKSMALSAKQRFPSNIECKTHNSMALKSITSRDASWGMMSAGKIGEMELAKIKNFFDSEHALTKFALTTLSNFIYSTDEQVSPTHFPLVDALFLFNGNLRVDSVDCVDFAQRIWLAMCDANSPLPMPHDGYLKMWSLSPGRLNYDFILIDESQDSNPAFLHGMRRQSCRQIFVGDEHQGIYSFRGAINALDKVEGAEKFTIQTTRRFGQNISHLANEAINLKNLVGNLQSLDDSANSLVIHNKAPLGTRPLYLARTNAGLFEKAISLAKQGKDFHLIGGGQKFQFPDLSDLLELARGQTNEANAYASFGNIDNLIDMAESFCRPDLAMRAKITKKYGEQLPAHLASINKKAMPAAPLDGEKEVASLSTVHQAKGLEAQWVELLDDFPKPTKISNEPTAQQIEELNILYVAITRARDGLATGTGAVSDWAKTLPPPKAAPEAESDLF